MQPQSKKNILALILLVVASSIVWLTSYLSYNRNLDILQETSFSQLDQFIGHLDAQLARYEFTPELIARNKLLVEVLEDADNSARIEVVNRFLEDINEITGASDTYLMNDKGLTIAASNWQAEQTFVGKNFSFRPYFTQAMQGQSGRYFAVGTTSGKRGYYFSWPITSALKVIGAIVVKMDLSNIERRWSGRNIQFLVTDKDGVTFITTNPDWLYKSIYTISKPSLSHIKETRRYHQKKISSLNFTVKDTYEEAEIVSLKGSRTQYFSVKKNMPSPGWQVMALASTAVIKRSSLIAVSISVLIIMILLLVGLLVWLKIKRQQEKEQFQLESRNLLEKEVLVRTSDLRHEIEEHKNTELMLRDTQDELIQTAKLAVLGQMSASISHELNNPLSAIRSYAENARQYLKRDRLEKADDNLNRIAELTKRMATISSQLKFFARKSSGHQEVVEVAGVIQRAIEITKPQFKNSGLMIDTKSILEKGRVFADTIQLEQVVINLLNNAINAIPDLAKGKVIFYTEQLDDKLMIHVEDNGKGIEESNLNKIFDPFFTTRKSGLGLGLSISARIIDSMKGGLSAVNIESGGARFTITLQAVLD